MSYGDTLEGQMLADYVREGMTLIDAVRALGLVLGTVYARMKNDEKFGAMMEEARAQGYDAIANECMAIADDASDDTVDGKYGPRMNSEWVARSKLRVETRLKLLAKWHPHKYGEKLQIEQKSATVAIPVSDDPIEAQRAYEELMKGS